MYLHVVFRNVSYTMGRGYLTPPGFQLDPELRLLSLCFPPTPKTMPVGEVDTPKLPLDVNVWHHIRLAASVPGIDWDSP